ncbi:MAG: ATP-binding protein [Sulfitobacter sp.]
MIWLPFQSVRARLWTALALLTTAVICISAATWLSLERVDKRLQELHRQTLSQVAQALELSKRSTDLATSAPYLLNQRSNFLINQEGRKLLAALEGVSADWPASAFGEVDGNNAIVSSAIERVAAGVNDLITASSTLDAIQTDIRTLTSTLGTLRERAGNIINDAQIDDSQRLIWWRLQSMTSGSLNAAYAGNLIGVGEEHRRFLGQRSALDLQNLTDNQMQHLRKLDLIVGGSSGIFELRRRELSTVLGAQNALFRIRLDAGIISSSASRFAIAAEQFLADERTSSSSEIQLTKIIVIGIASASLLLALISASYVSRYVTFNMARISSAMVRLAAGDRSGSLPRKFTNKDEIGDLFRSFRIFRANALRLDRSNRQLDQRNALFQKVFTNISDGIAITDASGRISAQNPAMENILKLQSSPKITSCFVSQLNNSPFGQASKAANLSNDHRGYCELVGEEGQLVELRTSRLPDEGRVWLCSDVTERRKMVDRLQQIDRIETLGKVAGNTAHDFGNILSTIGTHAHLLEDAEPEKSKSSLTAIQNAIDYGTSLTQRLLAFAKKQHLAPEVIDLNVLVEGLVDLVEISLKSEVAFDVSYADEPLNVMVDPGQLESSLLNLILNANQAIAGRGEISVQLGVINGDSAYVIINDTGAGIHSDFLSRVVEPFFTTRAIEGGTGLGLSIAYGFVQQTGGDLKVTSNIGVGTKIEITLPLSTSANKQVDRYAGKTVLLVEDEGKARALAKAALDPHGFVVTEATTGMAALRYIKAIHFDLLVTDLDLGDTIDGWLLAEQFLNQDPTNHAIIISGRLSDSGPYYAANSKQIQCLTKPLNPSILSAVLGNIFAD